MPTNVDIANMALRLVGGRKITSFTEASESAASVDQFYENVYRASLREFRWNCAIVRKALSSDSTAPIFEYDYRYRIPTDPLCLRVLSLNDKRMQFEVEQEFILTNESDLKIKYIGRVSEGRLDDQAAKYIYYRLASEICFDLTGDNRRVEFLIAQIENFVLPTARLSGAIEKNIPDIKKQHAGWIDARDKDTIAATT